MFSLDNFVAEMKTGLDQFAAEYKEKHEKDPENFPLVLRDDEAGLWYDMFIAYADAISDSATSG